jgi:tight adherence protein C
MNVLLIFVLLAGALILIIGIQYLKKRKTYQERILRLKLGNADLMPVARPSFWGRLVRVIGGLAFFQVLFTAEFRKKLVQAGWLTKKAPELFIGSLILISGIFLGLILFLAVFFEPVFNFTAGSPFRLLISCVAFIYCCIALPRIMLDRQKKAYVKTMVRELADFFDLYIINVAAGKSNVEALKDTVAVIQDIYPKVGAQINFLIGELQTFPDHELAWQNFSDRIDNPEVKDAIKIMRHCDVLGLPVEHDLKLQINYMRQTYLTQIEEKITRLPTTLLFPMFLFIFPSLFIVILTPALIKVIEVLK